MSSTTTTTPITFTRLRSGEWGIRGPESEIVEGEVVAVTKRNGSKSFVTVERVLWRGDGIALAAIVDRRLPRSSRSDELDEDGAWGMEDPIWDDPSFD